LHQLKRREGGWGERKGKSERERVEAMFSSHGNINEKKLGGKGKSRRIQKIAFFAGTHCYNFFQTTERFTEFGKAKLDFGGLVLGSSQFFILP